MMDMRSTSSQHAAAIGVIAVLLSQISMSVGAGFAKLFFPVLGAYGVTALRITLAAAMLLLLYRPWRKPVMREAVPALIVYGAMLGLMNLSFYQALARIPIGIATGIEVMGPLAIVLLASRRPRDFLWLGLAVLGLFLLLPLRHDDGLDPVGLAFAFAAAACWALYIVFGKRVSGALGGNAAAWGMLVAATLTLPIGIGASGAAIFSPGFLLIGAGIALLSSAIPYSLEIEAMCRLPAHVFGMLLGACPAVGALVGYVILDEALTPIQWTAIICIIVSAVGSSIAAPRLRV